MLSFPLGIHSWHLITAISTIIFVVWRRRWRWYQTTWRAVSGWDFAFCKIVFRTSLTRCPWTFNTIHRILLIMLENNGLSTSLGDYGRAETLGTADKQATQCCRLSYHGQIFFTYYYFYPSPLLHLRKKPIEPHYHLSSIICARRLQVLEACTPCKYI